MPERHHYVPQVLLRNFSENDQIWIFDKHLSKKFKTNIKNAFVESDYNTVNGAGFTMKAEQILGRAEDTAAPILQRILDAKEILFLSEDDKAKLAVFVAIQYLRTKQSRRTFQLMREYMTARFPDAPQSQFEIPGLTPPEADKFASLDFIVKNLNDISQFFVEKDLVLAEASGGAGSFWISDHPVILHNDTPSDGLRSNLGFAVPGIQIYLPLSPSYALAYFCPTIAAELKAGVSKAQAAKSRIFSALFKVGGIGEVERLALADLSNSKNQIEMHLRCIKDEKKVRYNKQNMIFMNSRQVQMAYRFIGSLNNKFELAMDMLEKHPELRAPDHVSFS